MPKKTPKIDVITVKQIVHIPVDRDDRKAVDAAYKLADGLRKAGDDIGETAFYEDRLNRVPAPKPAPEASEPESKSEAPQSTATSPAGVGLAIPDNLKRTKKPEPAAAE